MILNESHIENLAVERPSRFDPEQRHHINKLNNGTKMSINPKYFCDGPEGHFFCDDLEMARKLVNMIELYDGDWTITELPLKGVNELPPTVLINPYTMEKRDYRDVVSDPTGVLIVEPGAPLKAAAPAALALPAPLPPTPDAMNLTDAQREVEDAFRRGWNSCRATVMQAQQTAERKGE